MRNNNNKDTELILASASPRRQELLQSLGIKFSVIASNIDETTELTDPVEIVSWLSLAKAKEVASQLKQTSPEKRTLVLGADTIVVLGSLILGKPRSRNEAFAMLMRLSGQEHKVYTGVSLVEIHSTASRSIYQVSSIFFRKIAESEAQYYAESDEPMDKAGAYALQGAAAAFVERVEGCYSNVIGLPLASTVQLLREYGISIMGTTASETNGKQNY